MFFLFKVLPDHLLLLDTVTYKFYRCLENIDHNTTLEFLKDESVALLTLRKLTPKKPYPEIKKKE